MKSKKKFHYREFIEDPKKRSVYKKHMLKVSQGYFDPISVYIGNLGEIVDIYINEKYLVVISNNEEVRCVPWDEMKVKIPEQERENFTICNGIIDFHEVDEQLDWEHIGYMLYPEMKEKAAQYFKEKMGELK
jgi:phage pi2 protein 07